MKRYIDPENQRYQYQALETLNGYSIEVLIVPSGDIVALTPKVAAQLNVTLPDNYRTQSGTRTKAEEELTRLAELNRWAELKDP